MAPFLGPVNPTTVEKVASALMGRKAQPPAFKLVPYPPMIGPEVDLK